MAIQQVRLVEPREQASMHPTAACVGTIVSLDGDGRPFVSFDGCESIVARVCTTDPGPGGEQGPIGASVLLVFDDEDRSRPVIVGFVRDTLAPVDRAGDIERALQLDASSLRLEARDEVVLHCGLGSLTIRADGKVVLRGTRVVSRASETNKIRGASVLIN